MLCSSSRRTRETLEGVGPAGEHVIEPELFSASTSEVLDRLRGVPENVASVMLIGHNPTMQMLVLRLATQDGSDGGGARRAAVERKFPTGALATLEFECGWAELAAHCSRLQDFVTPKEAGDVPGADAKAQAPPASRAAR